MYFASKPPAACPCFWCAAKNELSYLLLRGHWLRPHLIEFLRGSGISDWPSEPLRTDNVRMSRAFLMSVVDVWEKVGGNPARMSQGEDYSILGTNLFVFKLHQNNNTFFAMLIDNRQPKETTYIFLVEFWCHRLNTLTDTLRPGYSCNEKLAEVSRFTRVEGYCQELSASKRFRQRRHRDSAKEWAKPLVRIHAFDFGA